MQLNTMYFSAQGKYYAPFLSADGKELYSADEENEKFGYDVLTQGPVAGVTFRF